MPRLALAAAFAAGSLALLGGCRSDMRAAMSPPPVPPPQQELIPKPPVTSTPLVLQPGHWDWNGTGYVWEPARYVPRAGHGSLFMPGYWAQSASGWQWQPPHWM